MRNLYSLNSIYFTCGPDSTPQIFLTFNAVHLNEPVLFLYHPQTYMTFYPFLSPYPDIIDFLTFIGQTNIQSIKLNNRKIDNFIQKEGVLYDKEK